MKKIISILLATLMILTALPVFSFAKITTADKYVSDCKVGETFEFGSYPQSEVTDAELISALDAVSAEWISYGCYISNAQSDFMK